MIDFTPGEAEGSVGFTKTKIPVDLLQYGPENLISRSQAKRILARLDRFREIIFDFKGVRSVGQGFVDEIFRVFANEHPNISLHSIRTNAAVERMIARARESENNT